ncbi:MAG: hypothetical protein J6Q63_01640 [Bacteroidales bacterium]|nr:hypothetical protein [Bacteroidales bacterium]
MTGSFAEYVSERTIIDLVVKERVKIASKGSLSGKSVPETALEIQKMTPRRNDWRRLRLHSRVGRTSTEELNTATLRNTINFDLRKYRSGEAKAPKYLRRLLEFTSNIIDIVNSDAPIDFNDCIRIMAKFKKNEGDTAIYRPLSIYTSLEAKTLISLATGYLSSVLDKHLHKEILSYRPKREYHGQKHYATDGNDAIIGLRKFTDDHRGQHIYVAECDIQKFFDIINHDVVLKCFADIASEAGLPDYHQVERILKAYLDSYSFQKDVMNLNDDENYWSRYQKQQEIKNHRFAWVDDECFSTCYESEEEFKACRDYLGVPQGGALSCIISNVVLNSVDKAVVDENDPDRFFVRYGDDILLAHTSYEKCHELMDSYVSALEAHHLPYHQFKPLTECKDGAKTLKSFWDMKSKEPFLWGPGEGNAFEWIGFVGYEVRYTGEVRMRKSTLDKKFGAINKKYHSCLRKDKPKNFPKYIQSTRRKLSSISSSLTKMKALKLNRYSIFQAKSLDRYRLQKIQRLQAKLTRKFYHLSWETGKSIDLEYNFITQREKGAEHSFYSKLTSISNQTQS